jgi:hypothetical protein
VAALCTVSPWGLLTPFSPLGRPSHLESCSVPQHPVQPLGHILQPFRGVIVFVASDEGGPVLRGFEDQFRLRGKTLIVVVPLKTGDSLVGNPVEV